jgi:hypothetical protein
MYVHFFPFIVCPPSCLARDPFGIAVEERKLHVHFFFLDGLAAKMNENDRGGE